MPQGVNPQRQHSMPPPLGRNPPLGVARALVASVLLWVGMVWQRQRAGTLIVRGGKSEGRIDIRSTVEFPGLLTQRCHDDLRRQETNAVLKAWYHLYLRDRLDLLEIWRHEPGATALAPRRRRLLFALQGPCQQADHSLSAVVSHRMWDTPLAGTRRATHGSCPVRSIMAGVPLLALCVVPASAVAVQPGDLRRYCRTVRLWRHNLKIGYQQCHDLQTAKLSKKPMGDRSLGQGELRRLGEMGEAKFGSTTSLFPKPKEERPCIQEERPCIQNKNR